MDVEFSAELVEWRGPSPFYWLRLSDEAGDYVREEAAEASYGWGAVPVTARIGASTWETSLLPKDGGYLLPVRAAIRERERLAEGDVVSTGVTVAPRGGRRARTAVELLEGNEE